MDRDTGVILFSAEREREVEGKKGREGKERHGNTGREGQRVRDL